MSPRDPNQPAGDVKAMITRFWTERANTFDSSPSHVSQSEEETAAWKDMLLRLTSGQTGLSVLDVGTGTGFLALLLAEMGQLVTGIDASTGMLEQAREKASKSGLEVSFVEADAENTGFDDSCFDLVISRHVLWNLPNPAQALSECKRVVRPAGTVAVIDGLWNPDKMRTHLKDVWGEAHREVFEKLPLYGGAPAEKVAALFSDQGLVNVQVWHLDFLVRLKQQTLPDDMKDSYSTDRYLVAGTRPGST